MASSSSYAQLPVDETEPRAQIPERRSQAELKIDDSDSTGVTPPAPSGKETSPTTAELQRTMTQMQQKIEGLETPALDPPSMRRDSVSSSGQNYSGVGRDTVSPAERPFSAAATWRRAALKASVTGRFRSEEEATLTVMAHGFIEAVSYNGETLQGVDPAIEYAWGGAGKPPKFRFRPVHGGVLSVKARCSAESAATRENLRFLAVRCVSNRSESAWNFALSPENAKYLVRAKNHNTEDQPEGWTGNDFMEDDEWKVPVSIAESSTTSSWSGRIGPMEAVWHGELCTLFRFDVTRFGAQGRSGTPLHAAIALSDPLAEIRSKIEGDDGRELTDGLLSRHPWLRTITQTMHQTLSSATENETQAPVTPDGSSAHTSAVVDCPPVMLYSAIKDSAHPSVVSFLLHQNPQLVLVDDSGHGPMYLAINCGTAFESVAELLVVTASFRELTTKEVLLLGQHRHLRNLTERFDTASGLLLLESWLRAAPNVIMSCLAIAQALRLYITFEPSQKVVLARAVERVMDLATEFALQVDSKVSQLDDAHDVRQVTVSLLQPNPEHVLMAAVRLHDIDTISVPWVLDCVHMLSGSSLLSLAEIHVEAGGRSDLNMMFDSGAAPFTSPILVDWFGSVDPHALLKAWAFVRAASDTEKALLVFRSPFVRYCVHTIVYVSFVVMFTVSLTCGDADIGPTMTICAWLWAASTVWQELIQLCRGSRVYIENFWNWMELGTPLVVMLGMGLDDRRLHAWAVLMLWFKLLEVCQNFEEVGPLVAVIGRMTSRLFSLFALCVVFLLSWTAGMFTLLHPKHGLSDESRDNDNVEWQTDYQDLTSTVYTLSRVWLGEIVFFYEGAEYATTAQVMMITYAVLVVVLMLNLFIAVLSADHAQVAEDADKEFAFTQAETTLRLKEYVDRNTLPPPFNLLQFPERLVSMLRGDGWNDHSQRTAWVFWVALVLPMMVTLDACLSMLLLIALALQLDKIALIQEGGPLHITLSPWRKVGITVAAFLLGPLYYGVVLVVKTLKTVRLLCKIMVGGFIPSWDVSPTFEIPSRSMTLHDALAVRQRHWTIEEWDDMLHTVVKEVLGGELDADTVNPLRFNSSRQMKWLCERMMVAEKNSRDAVADVKLVAEQIRTTEVLMMEKMDAVIALLSESKRGDQPRAQ